MWNSDEIVQVLARSAQTSLEMKTSLDIERKKDQTLVTQADRAVEELMARSLASWNPQSSFMGEEMVSGGSHIPRSSLIEGPCYVADPIDGTAMYASGLPNWGNSLGYLEDGRFVSGAVILPEIGDALIGHGGRVYHQRFRPSWEGEELAFSPVGPGQDPWRQLSNPEGGAFTLSMAQDFARYGRINGKIPLNISGSCVYAFVQLILGRFAGYLTKVKIWDLAAVWPLGRAVGLKAFELDGTELDMDLVGGPWFLNRSREDALGEGDFAMDRYAVFSFDRDYAVKIGSMVELPRP